MKADVSAIVTLLVGLFGGGGIIGLANVLLSYRQGVRSSDVQRESMTVEGLKSLSAELRGDLDRLRDEREVDRERMDEQDKKIEAQRQRLDAQEKTARLHQAVLLGVIDRLRRVPPMKPADIIDYIRHHLPGIGEGA